MFHQLAPASTMKAIVQDRYGPPDVLQLREIEKPPIDDKAGVLLRVRAASINALDWHTMRGKPYLGRLAMGIRRPRFLVRGVDVAGVVEAVGKSVTRFRAGDEVFGGADGSFAECAATTEDRLVQKPRRATFEQAAAVPVAGLTALQGLRDHGNLQRGQRVLIYGAGGGVGTFAVQIAKALGAHVTAFTKKNSLELVRSIGADEVVDYDAQDFTKGGQRYDLFLDIGGTRSLADCQHALGPTGTLVIVGAVKAPLARVAKAVASSRLARRRIAVFIAKPNPRDLVLLKDLLEAGRLSPAIDRQYSLSEVPEAIRYVEEGRARGKVVIRMP
jgi:NADPH:quinone reductase-like Zn-dependent oxidoreductase